MTPHDDRQLAGGGPNLTMADAIFFMGHREIQLDDQQKADLLKFVRDDGKGLVASQVKRFTGILSAIRKCSIVALIVAGSVFGQTNSTPPAGAPFFDGSISVGNGVLYLQFPDGTPFGYYASLSSNWIYHLDLGYEYIDPANDAANSVYIWDLTTGDWWYTNPSLFPYLYDFKLSAWLYYFPGALPGRYTSNPRYFENMSTGQIFMTAVTGFSANATTISTSEGAPYGDCDFWVQAPSSCRESNFGYGPTAVMRLYICLSGEVTINSCSQQPAVTGPLPAAMLDSINAGIAAFAGTGMRLMIRFTYNFGPIGPGAMDAPISVISSHIDQLAPILLQNKDLIFALEAGFIGTWGEWHDSTNGNDTAAAQQVVLDKELSYFSGIFPVLARYPGDLVQYTGNPMPPAGLGLHDDYYASSSDDGGTWDSCDTGGGWCLPNYSSSQLMSYAAEVSADTMFAGEFGALYPSLQTCAALDAYSYTYHAQSITLYPYPDNIGTELQNEGCALSFYNKVGTRIVLQQAQIEGYPIAGGQLSIAVTLMNAGYGRVIRPRPATIVFIQNGQTAAQIPVPLQSMDLRTLQPSMSATFAFGFTLPATLQSGPVSVALLIPDPAPSLTSDPAYALPLNSLDQNSNAIFDPTTGYNFIDGSGPFLGSAFQLASAGGLTSNPNEVIDGMYSIKGSYTGTGAYTPYLETVPAVLPLTPNHSYRVTFRYKILTAPSNGFEILFYSPTGGAAGSFLPSVTVTGQAGATGVATLTNTLGPYSDYQARWDIPGTGAISIDDIQIIDVESGTVIAAANAEPLLASLLTILQ